MFASDTSRLYLKTEPFGTGNWKLNFIYFLLPILDKKLESIYCRTHLVLRKKKNLPPYLHDILCLHSSSSTGCVMNNISGVFNLWEIEWPLFYDWWWKPSDRNWSSVESSLSAHASVADRLFLSWRMWKWLKSDNFYPFDVFSTGNMERGWELKDGTQK